MGSKNKVTVGLNANLQDPTVFFLEKINEYFFVHRRIIERLNFDIFRDIDHCYW